MPLNSNAINEILQYCTDGIESTDPHGDLLALAAYATDIERLRGNQPGIAKRAQINRALRQALHVVAGIAQFIANRYEAGVRDDNDLDKIEEGLRQAILSIAGNVHGEYLAIPDTLCLRSPGDARTQVGDAKLDMDAINYRTMKQYVHSNAGVGNVDKPVITGPEDDAIQQSLSFPVTVTALQLILGGTESPLHTRFVVLSENGVQRLSEGEMAYTTTPTVSVPESEIGKRVQIRVQYEDALNGTSAWSDSKFVRIAAAIAKPVMVISPIRGATGVIPGVVPVTISAGEWSDGSPFVGGESRLHVYRASDNALVYDSNEVPYTTSFVVPKGFLNTATTYWVMGVHRASTPPASNPNAIRTTPLYGNGYPTAGLFTTIPATAPNVSALTHTIPAGMMHGTQKTFSISGATSVDGGDITYRIDRDTITGGLSFSKYEGITEGETVTVYAPTIASDVVTASVKIVAVSSFGGVANPVTANMVIVSRTRWVFTESAVWSSVFEGIEADVWAGAGGNGNTVRLWGGWGGNCSYGRIILENRAYNLVIGAGGTGWITGDAYILTPGSGKDRGGNTSFDGIIIAAPRNMGGDVGQIVKLGGLSALSSPAEAYIAGGGGAGDVDGGNGGSFNQGGTSGSTTSEMKTGEDGKPSAYTASLPNMNGKAGVAGGGGSPTYSADKRGAGDGGRGSIIVELVI